MQGPGLLTSSGQLMSPAQALKNAGFGAKDSDVVADEPPIDPPEPPRRLRAADLAAAFPEAPFAQKAKSSRRGEQQAALATNGDGLSSAELPATAPGGAQTPMASLLRERLAAAEGRGPSERSAAGLPPASDSGYSYLGAGPSGRRLLEPRDEFGGSAQPSSYSSRDDRGGRGEKDREQVSRSREQRRADSGERPRRRRRRRRDDEESRSASVSRSRSRRREQLKSLKLFDIPYEKAMSSSGGGGEHISETPPGGIASSSFGDHFLQSVDTVVSPCPFSLS